MSFDYSKIPNEELALIQEAVRWALLAHVDGGRFGDAEGCGVILEDIKKDCNRAKLLREGIHDDNE